MVDFIQEGSILLVDKPLQWTSFDVVKKIKIHLQKISGKKRIKVGHAGTLDPLATGLLIICTGKKTKTISLIQDQVKEYRGIIQLGATTPSFDLETEPENHCDIQAISEEMLHKTAQSFEGEIMQTPPIFSAVKFKGKRAYEYARKGREIKLKEKKITINQFHLSKIDLPEIHFKINCSKGTYVRSLANDFGEKLKVGGYLKQLRRTKIGSYDVNQAQELEELIQMLTTSLKEPF